MEKCVDPEKMAAKIDRSWAAKRAVNEISLSGVCLTLVSSAPACALPPTLALL